jgi:hypothetical protein
LNLRVRWIQDGQKQITPLGTPNAGKRGWRRRHNEIHYDECTNLIPGE